MRGMATAMRRSKNSHIRSPRSVTLHPIAWPSRSLKAAIDLRALVTIGFWPVIAPRSATAASSSDGCWVARPTPMLTTILVSAGTCITLASSSCSLSAGFTSLMYFVRSAGCTFSSVALLTSDLLAGGLGDAHLRAVVFDLVADAGRLALVDEHHVGSVDRHVLVDDAALLVLLAGLLVLASQVDAADDHL